MIHREWQGRHVSFDKRTNYAIHKTRKYILERKEYDPIDLIAIIAVFVDHYDSYDPSFIPDNAQGVQADC